MLRIGGLAITTELAVPINIVVSEEVKEILIPPLALYKGVDSRDIDETGFREYIRARLRSVRILMLSVESAMIKYPPFFKRKGLTSGLRSRLDGKNSRNNMGATRISGT